MKRLYLPLLFLVAAASARATGSAIAIDAAAPAGNVSRLFYGLMTEEINHAHDGSLYAELSGVRSGFTYAVSAHAIVVLTLEAR